MKLKDRTVTESTSIIVDPEDRLPDFESPYHRKATVVEFIRVTWRWSPDTGWTHASSSLVGPPRLKNGGKGVSEHHHTVYRTEALADWPQGASLIQATRPEWTP